MKIREINFGKQNSNTVYHYTSPEGLLSILQSRALRFTDCQFFNDKLEYIYIKKPISQIMNKMSSKMRNQYLVENVDMWLKGEYEVYEKEKHLKERYYVFCTSTDHDSLNMWNYYIKNNKYQGYNIGISIGKLLKYLEELEYCNYEIWHGPVVYNNSEQEKIIFDLIQKLDEILWKIKSEVSFDSYWNIYLQKAQEEIINSIEVYRLFFKDSAFMQEKEYRFVLKVPIDIEETSCLASGYRIREGIISPYVDLKFDEEILESITLAPMLEKEIAKKGIELFMDKTKYKKDIELIDSSIWIR